MNLAKIRLISNWRLWREKKIRKKNHSRIPTCRKFGIYTKCFRNYEMLVFSERNIFPWIYDMSEIQKKKQLFFHWFLWQIKSKKDKYHIMNFIFWIFFEIRINIFRLFLFSSRYINGKFSTRICYLFYFVLTFSDENPGENISEFATCQYSRMITVWWIIHK